MDSLPVGEVLISAWPPRHPDLSLFDLQLFATDESNKEADELFSSMWLPDDRPPFTCNGCTLKSLQPLLAEYLKI